MKAKNLFLVTMVLLFGVVLVSRGQSNTVLGVNSPTPGSENIIMGAQAGVNIVNVPTVYGNILIGVRSGEYNTSGIENVFLGLQCGLNNTTGSKNTFVGTAAGKGNLTGDRNSSLGYAAGISNGLGDDNVNMGYFSGISGSRNTCIGTQSGYGFGNGDGNVLLGYKAGNITSLFNKSNILVIENGLNNTPLLYGEFDNKNIEFNVDKDSSSRVVVKSGAGGTSGLRFQNLTSAFVPTDFANKFLTVDTNGDVILRNLPPATTTGNFWGLNGNAGTFPSTAITAPAGSSFLGTTDNNDLVFRRNNVRAGVLSILGTSLGINSGIPVLGSVFVGNNAGFNETGGNNTYIGAGAGSSPTAVLRGNNTFIGANVGTDAKGSGNVYIGNGVASALIPPTEANTLRIHNNNNANSLIFGNFLTRNLTFNADGANSLVTISTLIGAAANGTRSGLRFDDYTINTPAITTNTTNNNKFLTLNTTGDVILQDLPPGSSGSDSQTLSIVGNQLTISNGNTVNLPSSSSCNLYSCDGTLNTVAGLRTVTMANNNLFFQTNPAFDGNGRVYIGSSIAYNGSSTGFPAITATSQFRLLVEGGILSERVKVALRSTNNWSDYVFADDYKLMSLKDIEAYVKQNKHLPGIESAETLFKEGLDLGDMQAKQMAKIEELTLYAIEQNKQLEKQSKEIEELKAQMKALLEKK